MPPRLLEQTSIFCGVFCVSKSLENCETKKLTVLTGKLRIHVRISAYQTWPITRAGSKIIFLPLFRVAQARQVALERPEKAAQL